jgi:transposase
LLALKAQILAFDRRIMAWHRSNETSKRLDEIPGVGPALATALVALLIQRHSDRGVTSRPGLGWYRSRTRAGVKKSLAASASRAIAICAACSRPACSATIWMRARRQSGWPFWRSRREDDCRGVTITQAISS